MAATVRDVVADVVAQRAPQEQPLVDGLARLDPDEVVGLLSRRRTAREPLGFGLSEAVAVITPVVWMAVDEACRSAVTASVGGARLRLVGGMRRLLRRPPAESLTVPELTREQLQAVHRRVREGADRVGLDESAALGLADTVVARLALERPATAEEQPATAAEPGGARRDEVDSAPPGDEPGGPTGQEPRP
jgi:hypothetical protein